MGTLTGFATSVGFVVASGIGLPHILGSSTLWHWAYILGIFYIYMKYISIISF